MTKEYDQDESIIIRSNACRRRRLQSHSLSLWRYVSMSICDRISFHSSSFWWRCY